MKIQPKRTCIVCRKEREKGELIRISKSPEGEISIDRTGKKPGRGAYICDNLECIQKCVKTKGLNRAFKMEISAEVYEALRSEYIGEN